MTRARDLADSADKDISGTLTVDDLTASGDVTIAGDLTVSGTTSGGGSSGTHTGDVVGNVTGNLTGDVTAAIVDVSNEIQLQGAAGNDGLIQKNASSGRDELQIYSGGDAYSTGSRGAGIHLYGNSDSQHDGHFAVLTGTNDNGDARIIASGRVDKTHVTIGNGIWNYVDNGEDPALLNLKSPSGQPALNIEGASGSEGDIVTPDGEAIQIGHWNKSTSAFTERVRLSSSGDLLVGMTTNSITGTGIGLVRDGTSHMYSGGTHTLELGRGGSDGSILEFNRSGTSVGSIGAKSNDLYIGEGDTGVKFDAEFETIVPFNTSTQANRDAEMDLGYSSVRWKDLYLSGGVYLDGTNSANRLDSYERGTWTPVAAGSSGTAFTYGEQQGHYIKVGDMVTAWYNLTNVSGSMTGHLRVGGLPFAANWMSGFNGEGVGTPTINRFTNIEGKYMYCLINDASTNIYFYHYQNTNNDVDLIEAQHKVDGAADIRGFVTYYTGG